LNDPLPTNVRSFIAQQIESVAQLETLLLLRRDPQRSWSAVDLSRQLYISEQMCTVMLNDLERRRFLDRDQATGLVRYKCELPAADLAVALLDDLYRERRVAIISEIHSTPLSKVQTFADAFRFRKDESP
jgi:hypothetical protein